MTALVRALKYSLQLVFATALPMLLAVAAVFICAVCTDLLRMGITGAAYQRVATTPPFVVHLSIALLLGYILGGRTANRMFALWVWAVPALWMLFAVLVWKPTTGVGESVWGYFFGGAWWGLPASPVRGKWVADQFTHTVPLYTSIAYALGAVLRRPRHSEQVSTPDAVPVVK